MGYYIKIAPLPLAGSVNNLLHGQETEKQLHWSVALLKEQSSKEHVAAYGKLDTNNTYTILSKLSVIFNTNFNAYKVFKVAADGPWPNNGLKPPIENRIGMSITRACP